MLCPISATKCSLWEVCPPERSEGPQPFRIAVLPRHTQSVAPASSRQHSHSILICLLFLSRPSPARCLFAFLGAPLRSQRLCVILLPYHALHHPPLRSSRLLRPLQTRPILFRPRHLLQIGR